MNTAEIILDNWEAVQGRLVDDRSLIHSHLLASARPQTTAEMAAGIGLSILSVRPRVTELCQLGFVELAGKSGREGMYSALPVTVARENWQRARERRLAVPVQVDLPL